MLPVVNWRDPRLQPCAYVSDGRRLFEVVAQHAQKGVTLENCLDESLLVVGPREIVPKWTLIREAPAALCPDVLEAA